MKQYIKFKSELYRYEIENKYTVKKKRTPTNERKNITLQKADSLIKYRRVASELGKMFAQSKESRENV